MQAPSRPCVRAGRDRLLHGPDRRARDCRRLTAVEIPARLELDRNPVSEAADPPECAPPRFEGPQGYRLWSMTGHPRAKRGATLLQNRIDRGRSAGFARRDPASMSSIKTGIEAIPEIRPYRPRRPGGVGPLLALAMKTIMHRATGAYDRRLVKIAVEARCSGGLHSRGHRKSGSGWRGTICCSTCYPPELPGRPGGLPL